MFQLNTKDSNHCNETGNYLYKKLHKIFENPAQTSKTAVLYKLLLFKKYLTSNGRFNVIPYTITCSAKWKLAGIGQQIPPVILIIFLLYWFYSIKQINIKYYIKVMYLYHYTFLPSLQMKSVIVLIVIVLILFSVLS